MIIYRYENEDGGGPYYTLDGINRKSGIKLEDSSYIFGCTSIDKLETYFKNKNDIKGCTMTVRDIPNKYIICLGDDQVLFPKIFMN